MANVKITYAKLEEIGDSYAGCSANSVARNLEELKDELKIVEEEIEASTSNTATTAEKKLVDVYDSIRGLEISFEEISQAIYKYLERMEGNLEATDDDKELFVTDEIDTYKSAIKEINSNTKDALRSNIWNIHTITINNQNKNLKDLANMSIDNYNEYTAACRKQIDEKYDSILKEVKVLKEWKEDDYYESYHIVSGLAVIGAEIGICMIPGGIFALAAFQATKSVVKMYQHGYSFEGAIAGGIVKGGITIAGGKAGEVLGSRASKYASNALRNGSSSITNLSSKMADSLLESKVSTEWAENVLKNNSLVSYIEGTADGIEVSRYIKGDNFNVLQTKYKYEFDNLIEFNKISSDEILESASNLENKYNSVLDDINAKQTILSTRTEERMFQLSQYFDNVVEAREKIGSIFDRKGFVESTIDSTVGMSLDELVEKMNENQNELKEQVRIELEKSLLKGFVGV